MNMHAACDTHIAVRLTNSRQSMRGPTLPGSLGSFILYRGFFPAAQEYSSLRLPQIGRQPWPPPRMSCRLYFSDRPYHWAGIPHPQL